LVETYKKFPISAPHWEQTALVGEVVYIDRFGNLITNFSTSHIKEWQEVTKRPNPSIRLSDHLIDGLVGSYSEGDEQSPRALINSEGLLEIFLRESSAAARLSVARHEIVRLS
jgi:S-adenosylmethionine hydrolase